MMIPLIRNSLNCLTFLKPNPSVASVIVPNRNTYVLKRTYPVTPRKKYASKPKPLEERHFVYELVEDTNLTEPPDLNVVLTTFVEGVGDVGDVISVKAHFARKHLLLPRKAIYATPENIEYYQKLKEKRPEKPEFSSIYAGMTLRFLSKKVVPLFLNSEESWTVEAWHIRVAFRLEGVIVPEDAIKLPDVPIVGPDPEKENKDFVVTVTVNNTETVPVRCRIFHIRQGIGITKLSEEFYLDRRDAVIKEQEEILANLPLPEIEDNRPESNISLKEKYRIKLVC